MNLAGNSTAALTESKAALDTFLGNEEALQRVRSFLALGADILGAERIKLLHCFEKTFCCYIIESADARQLRTRIDELEVKYYCKALLPFCPVDNFFISITTQTIVQLAPGRACAGSQ